MIFYSTAYATAQAAAGTPLTLARILYDSYTRNALPSSVTVSTADPDFPADAPLRADTYERWKPTAIPATWLYEFGSTKSFNSIGIAGHNYADSGIAVAAEYQLGAGAWTAFSSAAAPGDNSPIFLVGTLASASRIRLTLTGTVLLPQTGVVYVGQSLVMPQPIDGKYVPITMGRDTVLKSAMSRTGQFIGQDYRRNGVASSIGFKLLTGAFVRNSFDAFVKLARRYPYFLAWNANDFPAEVGYVWTEKDIKPSYMQMAQFMEVNWDMKGVGST